MRCPRCGADMRGNEVCGKCSLETDDYRKAIEVKYKDFKTSELLEIRQKKHFAPPFEETKAPQKEKAVSRQTKKSAFPLYAIVLLILALISGVFLVVRYLIKQ